MRSFPVVAIRASAAVAAIAAWFWTQSLIGGRAPLPGGIGDRIHDMTAPLHAWLGLHPEATDLLLITSSAIVDLLGMLLLASAILGRSLRPLLALILVFGLRQICQLTCVLPPPSGMIWHDPGFPTLLVTYGVANDLFFSGHTAIALLGAMELSRYRRPWGLTIGCVIALFEMTTVLVLRAHYTMDVFTAFFVAPAAYLVARSWAPTIDRHIDKLAGAAEPEKARG